MPPAIEETLLMAGAAAGVPIVVVTVFARASDWSLMNGATVNAYDEPLSSSSAV